MPVFTAVRTLFTNRMYRRERGQASVEYVLIMLSVVLFLIFAAIALQPVLRSATSSISSWIAGNNAPP